MWSFAKNPEPRFRRRGMKLLAASWQRPGRKGFTRSAPLPGAMYARELPEIQLADIIPRSEMPRLAATI